MPAVVRKDSIKNSDRIHFGVSKKQVRVARESDSFKKKTSISETAEAPSLQEDAKSSLEEDDNKSSEEDTAIDLSHTALHVRRFVPKKTDDIKNSTPTVRRKSQEARQSLDKSAAVGIKKAAVQRTPPVEIKKSERTGQPVPFDTKKAANLKKPPADAKKSVDTRKSKLADVRKSVDTRKSRVSEWRKSTIVEGKPATGVRKSAVDIKKPTANGEKKPFVEVPKSAREFRVSKAAEEIKQALAHMRFTGVEDTSYYSFSDTDSIKNDETLPRVRSAKISAVSVFEKPTHKLSKKSGKKRKHKKEKLIDTVSLDGMSIEGSRMDLAEKMRRSTKTDTKQRSFLQKQGLEDNVDEEIALTEDLGPASDESEEVVTSMHGIDEKDTRFHFFETLGEIPSLDKISLDSVSKHAMKTGAMVTVQFEKKDLGKFVDPLTGQVLSSSSSELLFKKKSSSSRKSSRSSLSQRSRLSSKGSVWRRRLSSKTSERTGGEQLSKGSTLKPRTSARSIETEKTTSEADFVDFGEEEGAEEECTAIPRELIEDEDLLQLIELYDSDAEAERQRHVQEIFPEDAAMDLLWTQQRRVMIDEGKHQGIKEVDNERERILKGHVNDFLNSVIKKVVNKVEGMRPAVLLRQTLDKNSLMLELIKKLEELEVEQKARMFLNRKIVEYYRRKNSLRYIVEDSPEHVDEAMEVYREALSKLDVLLSREQEVKDLSELEIGRLQNYLTETEEVERESLNRLETLMRNALKKENYNYLANVVNNQLARMAKIREEVSETRYRLIDRQHQLAKLKEKNDEMENVGQGWTIHDYENMQGEITLLDKKIEERNIELNKLHSYNNSSVHMIAHLKERHKMLRNVIAARQSCLDDLLDEKIQCRGYIKNSQLKRKKLRQEIKGLIFQGGLHGKPELIADYDSTANQINVMKGKVSLMKQKAATLTSKLNLLESQMKTQSDDELEPDEGVQ